MSDPQDKPSYTYLIVRTDLPLADQILQAAHAAQEAGARWGVPPRCHLVLLAVQDGQALREVEAACRMRNVAALAFEEPDPASGRHEPMGKTALCTAPLPSAARRLFRRLAAWRP